MKIKIKRSKENGEFYAVLIADNGKQVWKTSETYKRKGGVDKAVAVLNAGFDSFTLPNVIDETK